MNGLYTRLRAGQELRSKVCLTFCSICEWYGIFPRDSWLWIHEATGQASDLSVLVTKAWQISSWRRHFHLRLYRRVDKYNDKNLIALERYLLWWKLWQLRPNINWCRTLCMVALNAKHRRNFLGASPSDSWTTGSSLLVILELQGNSS